MMAYDLYLDFAMAHQRGLEMEKKLGALKEMS